MCRFIILAAVVLSFASSNAAEADDEGLKIAFNTHCRNCHSFKKGDNRLGPSLYRIVGANAGQVGGFNAYSGSLKGFSWDEATLDKFIASPASVSPTTNMIYPPVADAAERKKIIAFLKAISEP